MMSQCIHCDGPHSISLFAPYYWHWIHFWSEVTEINLRQHLQYFQVWLRNEISQICCITLLTSSSSRQWTCEQLVVSLQAWSLRSSESGPCAYPLLLWVPMCMAGLTLLCLSQPPAKKGKSRGPSGFLQTLEGLSCRSDLVLWPQSWLADYYSLIHSFIHNSIKPH